MFLVYIFMLLCLPSFLLSNDVKRGDLFAQEENTSVLYKFYDGYNALYLPDTFTFVSIDGDTVNLLRDDRHEKESVGVCVEHFQNHFKRVIIIKPNRGITNDPQGCCSIQ